MQGILHRVGGGSKLLSMQDEIILHTRGGRGAPEAARKSKTNWNEIGARTTKFSYNLSCWSRIGARPTKFSYNLSCLEPNRRAQDKI